jgi:uncharacterized protein YfaS (alpha-2-macroglobulin family)
MKLFILSTLLILLASTYEGGSSPTLQVTVYTDKPYYNIEENIYILGEVKVDGVPVENATVALEVRDPTASPVNVRSLTTNALGKYDLSFKLSSQALTGTYTVNVSCSYLGERATSTASFNLEKASFLVVTLTIGRSAYKIEEPIEIYGNVTLTGVPVLKALVAIEVQDPKYTPILVRVVETDTNGLYGLTFQLPSGSSTGTYSVYASASYGNQKAVANSTFQLKREIAADINGDGVVNILDIALVAKAWGAYPGHPRWDQRCDLDGNNIINIIDIALVAREYGR